MISREKDALSFRILNRLFAEWPILKKMQPEKVSILVKGIVQMRDFGVNSFALRTVDKNGYSAMFCTNILWPELSDDDNFYKDFMNHISSELVQSYKDKNLIISRSRDKVHSPFLQKLEKAGQNNSIIINNFYDDKAEIIYYMGDPNLPQDRDRILNNLHQLTFIKESFDSILKEIVLSSKFKEQKKILLNVSAINLIWQKGFNKNKPLRIFVDKDEMLLTTKELECLAILRYGASNQFIADALKISVETVKSHISHLKDKFGTSSRKTLIEMSQKKALTSILNLISKL
jgi:DNA-binding CsgD family transcriptional regulator